MKMIKKRWKLKQKNFITIDYKRKIQNCLFSFCLLLTRKLDIKDGEGKNCFQFFLIVIWGPVNGYLLDVMVRNFMPHSQANPILLAHSIFRAVFWEKFLVFMATENWPIQISDIIFLIGKAPECPTNVNSTTKTMNHHQM